MVDRSEPGPRNEPRISAMLWSEDKDPWLLDAQQFRSETELRRWLGEIAAKYKDIAVLMSMGARQSQIRRIFMLQGMLIGVVGSAIGLVLGYGLCYFAEKYRWIPLDPQVYSVSFVPFETRWFDGLWIAAAAILVSFLATIYPARAATRITPAEVLRYE